MKIKVAREAYYGSSATCSTTIRQLGLAGIAVIWLLAGGLQTSGVNLTKLLLSAGLLIVIGLFLDLAQYVWTTARFAVWTRKEEKAYRDAKSDQTADADEHEIGNAPKSVLPIMWVLFYGKAAAIAAAYILIFIQLGDRLRVS